MEASQYQSVYILSRYLSSLGVNKAIRDWNYSFLPTEFQVIGQGTVVIDIKQSDTEGLGLGQGPIVRKIPPPSSNTKTYIMPMIGSLSDQTLDKKSRQYNILSINSDNLA